jgi:hypothetical protein
VPTVLPNRRDIDRTRRNERAVMVAQAVVTTIALLLVAWNVLVFESLKMSQPYRASPFPDGPFELHKR